MDRKTQKLKKLLKNRLFEGIVSLTPKELRVVNMRCGLENDKIMSYNEIAEKLSISSQGVHDFVKKAIRKLFYKPFLGKGKVEFTSRNTILVKTKDENPSMSFTEVGRIFGIDRGTAHKIYLREKRKKKEKRTVPLDDF